VRCPGEGSGEVVRRVGKSLLKSQIAHLVKTIFEIVLLVYTSETVWGIPIILFNYAPETWLGSLERAYKDFPGILLGSHENILAFLHAIPLKSRWDSE